MCMRSTVNIYYEDYGTGLYSRLWCSLYSSVMIIQCKLGFGVNKEFNVLTSILYIIIANELTKHYFGQQWKPYQ